MLENRFFGQDSDGPSGCHKLRVDQPASGGGDSDESLPVGVRRAAPNLNCQSHVDQGVRAGIALLLVLLTAALVLAGLTYHQSLQISALTEQLGALGAGAQGLGSSGLKPVWPNSYGSKFAGTDGQGVVTDQWGIRSSAFPSDAGPTEQLQCITKGLVNASFYTAELKINCDAAAFQNWTFDSRLPWMQGKSSMCDKGFKGPTGNAFVAIDEDGRVAAGVDFQDLNPFANTEFAAQSNPGAVTPIIAMHLHQGAITEMKPPLAYFCGQLTPGLHDLTMGPQVGYDQPVPALESPPAAAKWWPSNPVPSRIWRDRAPNLPPCSQRTRVNYEAKFMTDNYGVYQDDPSHFWLDYLKDNNVTRTNIEDELFFLLHTTFSWASTGLGLIRGQLRPASLSDAPAFATAGC